MPWTMRSAQSKTRKATSPVAQRQWAHVANKVLKSTGDDGRAIMAANAVVARRRSGKKSTKKGTTK